MEEFALFSKTSEIPLEEYEFKKGSTIGCGGVVNAVFPRSFTELIEVVDWCEEKQKRYCVLGNASNVLPPEAQSDTLFIFTKRLVGATFGKTPLVYAGMTAGAFLKECEAHGKSGAEFLAGVPCTMGGAAYMNAGAAGKYLSEIIKSVIVYQNGELRSFPKSECDYSYKHSRFMEKGGVIFAVMLDLTDETPEAIARKKAEYLNRRKSLPTGRSMGCIFKNPDGQAAGKLIEGAGLKGLRLGDAFVSEEHANFIINGGNATVKEIKKLIEIVKNAVYAQYRVRLEEEIRYLE
ncbi:MAG: UDP-N-acetylmuramate dehydrogenase [Clostridia bacterium]|nr:UDP-N-acetylmuramate dehydrogenase [Clostridia bacterium]